MISGANIVGRLSWEEGIDHSRMISFPKTILLISSWLFSWQKCLTIGQDKLAMDASVRRAEDFLLQLASYTSIKELYLEGFGFDEKNVIKFSDIISTLSIEKLTLFRCNLDDYVASHLRIPTSLKSIRFEQMNCSAKGIQLIISKLSNSLESLEILHCYEEINQQIPLNLSRFPSLKTFCLDNSFGSSIDMQELLNSLVNLPLEIIKLKQLKVSPINMDYVLKSWTSKINNSLVGTLKEFYFEIHSINEEVAQNLINCILSINSLEVFWFAKCNSPSKISLPPIPPSIREFGLEGFKSVFNRENNEMTFSNIKNFSQLTHLSVTGEFEYFPYELFQLKQLEYLDLIDIKNKFLPSPKSILPPSCDKLKHLLIGSLIFYPFLNNLSTNFPVIETIELNIHNYINMSNYLEKLLFSNHTLKSLKLYFPLNRKQYYLHLDQLSSSSIEELVLVNVSWKYASDMMWLFQFIPLKKIELCLIDEEIDLDSVIEKLNWFPHLTSLSLSGYFHLSKQCKGTFKALNFFELHYKSNSSLDLNLLLNCMPNLTELYLKNINLESIILDYPINIRYLHLTVNFDQTEKTLNLVKNLPRLVQWTNYNENNLSYNNGILAIDLAHYLNMLKIHFRNELKFKIEFDCLPILFLQHDLELLQLVRCKSQKLFSYFQDKFPFHKYKRVVEQLFTIKLGNEFLRYPIDSALWSKFFLSIIRLGIGDSSENIFFTANVLLGNNRNKAISRRILFDLNDQFISRFFWFSIDSTVDLFYHLLVNNFLQFQLEKEQLSFAKQFLKQNKEKGFSKVGNFLKYYFAFLTRDGHTINRDLYELFTPTLLTGSFRPLFNNIRLGRMNLKEVKALKLLSLDYNCLNKRLRLLPLGQYIQIDYNLTRLLTKFDASLKSFEKFISLLKVISSSEENCSICFESLETPDRKKIEIFEKGENSFCHLFHRDCLDRWFLHAKTCPMCRSKHYEPLAFF